MPAVHARCYSILNINSAIQHANSNDNTYIICTVTNSGRYVPQNNRTGDSVANYYNKFKFYG